MRLAQRDQVARAAGVKQLLARIAQESRKFADDGVIFLAVGFLYLRQSDGTDDGTFGLYLLPKLCERRRFDSGRARYEISPHAQLFLPELEMRTPAARHPSFIERRAKAIVSAVFRQDSQNMAHCLRIFAQDPIAIFAHDSQAVQNYGLTRADDGAQAAGVKLPGQFQINISHAGEDRTATRCSQTRAVVLPSAQKCAKIHL